MSATLFVEARSWPLTLDPSGRWRVLGTRIPMELVIQHYLADVTPEEIVEAYDTLRLADVYAVISYYLEHRDEVDEYIREIEAKGDEMEQMIRAAMPPRPELKHELLERWAHREAQNAQTPE